MSQRSAQRTCVQMLQRACLQRLHRACVARLQTGYSTIELSVALVIALFLLTGAFTILQSTRSTSSEQNWLAQLQEEERVAMTIMTDVIQQAGYYPGAPATDPTIVFQPSGNFPNVGQVVAGGTTAAGDTITVRYQGDATNNVLDCRGNLIGAGSVAEMTFSVQNGASNNGGPELFCTVNGVAAPIVPNVQRISLLYGVDTSGSGSTNAYLTPAQIAALTPAQITSFWTSVYSVKLTVTFINPLYGTLPGQTLTTPKTISFARVIGLMSKAGVNVINLY
jgi:type IV pilus assembly protein PilW